MKDHLETTCDCPKDCGGMKSAEGSNTRLIGGLSAAIGVFEKRMDDYDAWYYKQPRVSLAIMAERESLVDKCQWAIEELKKAQDR